MSLEGDIEDQANPNWRTIKNYPLRPRSLWKKWQDAKSLVGVRFGGETEYALIDIDRGSKLCNIDGINAIRDALETIGISRTIPIRSSWSGGLHLYCPLPNKVKTFDLACAIRYAFEAQELYIEAGQLEVFPNTKAFASGRLGQFSEYNGHRLPLQPGSGSCMLNDDLQSIGADLGRFFANWRFCAKAQDMPALLDAMTYGRDHHRKRPKLRSHPVDAWRDEWELDINEGWTGPNQTNGLLRVISGYGRVFLRLEGEELHEFVVDTAIHAPGFEDYCAHQYDIGRKAAAWCLAAERYYWPLGEAPKRDKTAFDINTERAEDAQARIKAAYEWLKKTGEWPETVTAQLKALSQKARTSLKTLYKYSHLWRAIKRCVISQPEGDSSDSLQVIANTPDRPKPLSEERLHTISQITKGVTMTDAPKSVHPGKGDGVRGRGKGFPQAERWLT
ncbi:MAG: hypothetical protein AAGC93_16665 [Cyanobacteria bacterium P01_F01_bin.53]